MSPNGRAVVSSNWEVVGRVGRVGLRWRGRELPGLLLVTYC